MTDQTDHPATANGEYNATDRTNTQTYNLRDKRTYRPPPPPTQDEINPDPEPDPTEQESEQSERPPQP